MSMSRGTCTPVWSLWVCVNYWKYSSLSVTGIQLLVTSHTANLCSWGPVSEPPQPHSIDMKDPCSFLAKGGIFLLNSYSEYSERNWICFSADAINELLKLPWPDEASPYLYSTLTTSPLTGFWLPHWVTADVNKENRGEYKHLLMLCSEFQMIPRNLDARYPLKLIGIGIHQVSVVLMSQL